MANRHSRRQGRRKEVVVGRFGEAVVTIRLRTGDIRVKEYGEIGIDDRNDATAWVLAHLDAIGMEADPLDIRDLLWK